MNRTLTGLILITILLCSGCSEEIIVVDASGRPVQGAAVAPVGLSVNGAAAMTDEKGAAQVPLSVGSQRTQWISVKKAGFNRAQVPVPSAWPLRVTLVAAPLPPTTQP